MTVLKTIMFFVGVMIVLVGLSLLVAARVEVMRSTGETIGPSAWATLIEAVADLWGQIVGSVEQEYRVGLTVLVIGVLVMVVPLSLPTARK